MSSDRSLSRALQQTTEPPDSSPSRTGSNPSKRRQSAPNNSTRSGNSDAHASRAPAAANGLQSEPMTTTTSSSSSSEVPAVDPASSSTTPAPYGTRSRGKNGAPRPNYAEDRDGDMEFEVTSPPPKSGGGSKRGAAPIQNTANGSPEVESDKGPGITTRRGQTTVNGTNSQSASKDNIPGTSTFSTTASSTRKRKQPSGTKKTSASASGAAKRSFSNMMTFENCGARLNNGKLKADNGNTISVNDHVYLICEPPGEPYYLARIMEFLPSKEDPSGPVEAVRVNWYYRPRDIQRKATDARLVFASMHSDTCPLASLRGKCSILHMSEIDDLEEYRKRKDCFWYDKMYDRYIHRSYEVIPTNKVINVPENVKKVLDERWKFVLVEMGRRKELTSEVKTCKRCGSYAASSDSVDCAVCRSTYHMFCVRPVLTKKPARGFAWACAACSRAQERKLEARNTPIINEAHPDAEEETLEEEEEEANGQASGTGRSSPVPGDGKVGSPRPATAEQMAHARMWPYRYLGIHCRVEDALDYDDRIYPRASSRLGPRHQATVMPWTGRPVEYVKAPDAKKKFVKAGYRGNMKPSKEALAALEAEKREKLKYLPRGEDEVDAVAGDQVRTAQLVFKMPESSEIPARGEDDAPGSELSEAERQKFIDDYMKRARSIAPEKEVEEYSTNFLDKALEFLYAESFNAEAALARLKRINKYSDLQEPHLRPEEVKLFEEGVARYGSELRNVTRHVKTVPHRHIVRFYYMWKKKPRGRQIWGNYEGRRGKKEAKRADASAKLVDDVADDHDDSAFDNDKAAEKKRRFECKFCAARSSSQWRRAPGTPPGTVIRVESSSRRADKGLQLTVALCLQCALLWRKYAIRWENVDEVAKKINQGSNKWRRRVDEELLTQLLVSTETPISISNATAATAASIGVNVMTTEASQEPAKKRAKISDKDSNATSTSASVEPVPKKKQPEKAPDPPPPLAPDPPRAKTLPCAVCDQIEPMGDEHISCRDCRLTVHRGCYGVSLSRNCTKWFCDMCLNDRNPTISTCYECVLCPVTWTELELMEPPKMVQKRKSDREREKERLEKEMVAEAIKLYRQRQEAVGKPVGPREPLKRTVGNNWVHVMCAIWTPEIKFGNAKELEPAEGFELISTDRFRKVCKICKKTGEGACVSCQHSGCDVQFHVGCAFQAQYVFGFEITPVKTSRRDSATTIKLGEDTGSATAAIWCPDHSTGPTRHRMSEPTGIEGLNALQVFTQKFKQADLSLTGTVRKAARVQQSVVGVSLQNGVSSSNRRASAANGSLPKDGSKSSGALPDDVPEEPPVVSSGEGQATVVSRPVAATDACKKCVRCSSTYSPRWWAGEGASQVPDMSNGTSLPNGAASSDRRYSSTTSATPPFHTRNNSQNSVSRVNGESSTPDRPAGAMHAADGTHQPGSVSYECNKCHAKKPVLPSSPEPRPSPYLSQRTPILPSPAPRVPEYVNHTYAPPHPHPQPGVLAQPLGPSHLHNGPEWYPGYDPRSGEFADPNLRNGLVPGGPNGIPAPGYYSAPSQHLNSYPPASHAPAPHPPPHYPSGAPPPPPSHSYSPHQNPYVPVPMSSPHHSHAALPRNYGTSTSPPIVHANVARHSPQRSLSGGPQPRVYSVDRVLAAPGPSPSISRSSVDPQLPGTPGQPDEPPIPGARPTSSGRYAGSNGTGTGSAASASPSLKNLLS